MGSYEGKRAIGSGQEWDWIRIEWDWIRIGVGLDQDMIWLADLACGFGVRI